MDNMKKIRISQVKQETRERLLGQWGRHTAISGILIAGILVMSFITDLFGTGFSAFLMQTGTAAILQLFLGLLFDGAFLYYLHLEEGRIPNPTDVFAPYQMQPDRFLLARLIKMAAGFLCYLPAILLSFVLDKNPLLWSIVLMALLTAGTVLYIIFRTAVSFTSFLLLTGEDMGAVEALRTSISLTKGRRLEIFLFLLSFAGYWLIGIFTLGIGFFWIIPYAMASFTHYWSLVTKK